MVESFVYIWATRISSFEAWLYLIVFLLQVMKTFLLFPFLPGTTFLHIFKNCCALLEVVEVAIFLGTESSLEADISCCQTLLGLNRC